MERTVLMHVSFILRVYQYLIVPGFFRTLLLPPQTKLRPTTLSPLAVLTTTTVENENNRRRPLALPPLSDLVVDCLYRPASDTVNMGDEKTSARRRRDARIEGAQARIPAAQRGVHRTQAGQP